MTMFEKLVEALKGLAVNYEREEDDNGTLEIKNNDIEVGVQFKDKKPKLKRFKKRAIEEKKDD